MQIRVYYEDTDVGGVVYHSNYLNFCERARSESFFQAGLSPATKDGQFVAKKIAADYIASAKLGDMLDVKTSLVEMKRASLILEQNIYKKDKKIFSMQIVLAYINNEGRPQKIQESQKEFLLLFDSDKSID